MRVHNWQYGKWKGCRVYDVITVSTQGDAVRHGDVLFESAQPFVFGPTEWPEDDRDNTRASFTFRVLSVEVRVTTF